MSLRSYKIPRLQVPLPDGEAVSVRGLSLNDLMSLADRYLEDMRIVFEMFAGDVEVKGASDMLAMAGPAIRKAPSLCCAIIAAAADEPDSENTVIMMPIGLQVELLRSVLIMTFRGENGPKEFLESLTNLFKGATALVKE